MQLPNFVLKSRKRMKNTFLKSIDPSYPKITIKFIFFKIWMFSLTWINSLDNNFLFLFYTSRWNWEGLERKQFYSFKHIVFFRFLWLNFYIIEFFCWFNICKDGLQYKYVQNQLQCCLKSPTLNNSNKINSM